VDVFVSHDWPRGIYRHGNAKKLVQNKKFFEKEVKENRCSTHFSPRLDVSPP
jgi:lariat debranching enzyme